MFAGLFRYARLGLLVLALAGCVQAKATPLPTLALGSGGTPAKPLPSGGGVTASGELVPVRQVQLGFSAAGVVAEVLVKEGDALKAGQAIASLGSLERLRAALTASQESLASAQKQRDNLSIGAALNLASADLGVVTAQKQYDDALKHRKVKDYHRCDQDTIDLYWQLLSDAKERLKRLEDNAESRDANYLRRLTAAQSEVDTANANYLFCIAYTPEEIAQSEAEINLAQASLNQAKARQDLLKQNNGIDPLELARLDSAVSSAQAALVSAQTTLEQSSLLCPVDGTLASLDLTAGQAVLPGQAVAIIASLDEFQAETTDLSEKDIARVKVGQAARVTVEALGREIPAHVARVTPRATKVGGDVVFKVVMTLDEQPAGLLWGMSVKVDFAETSQ